MDAERRPAARTPDVGRWLVGMGDLVWGLAAAYLPGGRALSSRSREQIVLAVTEVNGCGYTAWVHGAWRDFLGEDRNDAGLDVLVDYARASALSGAPLDTAHLDAVLPADAVRAVRATIAVAEVSNLVGNTAQDLGARLRGRRPLLPARMAREAAVVAAALPIAAPLLAAAGVMRLTSWVSPPMPTIVEPPDDEGNLVVAMLAEAVQVYLGHALVRALLLALPRPLVVGVRAEGVAATVRITRDRVDLEADLADDTVLVIDGGLDLLVDVASRALDRDLNRLTVG
jgi:hypothetical protein